MSRRPTYSTVPRSSPMRMRSPLPSVSSKRRKKPEMTSLTNVWAPNPIASPAMPAPARSARMSNPTRARTVIPAIVQIVYRANEPSRSATVRTRWRRLSSVGACMARRTHRRLIRVTTASAKSARAMVTATRTATSARPHQNASSRSASRAAARSATDGPMTVVSTATESAAAESPATESAGATSGIDGRPGNCIATRPARPGRGASCPP